MQAKKSFVVFQKKWVAVLRLKKGENQKNNFGVKQKFSNNYNKRKTMDFAAKRTVDQLVNNFGFTKARSEEAVRAITNKGDVQMACDWLLDNGEEDKGGAITLIVCDHFDADVEKKLAPMKELKYGERCVDCGNEGENWVCLFSGETRCSRYCQGHAKKHYEETKKRAEAETPIAALVSGAAAPLGDFLALSLMDLSVWCYECKGIFFVSFLSFSLFLFSFSFFF